MVKAAPAAAFVVAEPNLLLEFEIVAFDPPAHLRQIDQALEGNVGWQRGKPVVVRLGFALRPFDQQPLFIRGVVPLRPTFATPPRSWKFCDRGTPIKPGIVRREPARTG